MLLILYIKPWAKGFFHLFFISRKGVGNLFDRPPNVGKWTWKTGIWKVIVIDLGKWEPLFSDLENMGVKLIPSGSKNYVCIDEGYYNCEYS